MRRSGFTETATTKTIRLYKVISIVWFTDTDDGHSIMESSSCNNSIDNRSQAKLVVCVGFRSSLSLGFKSLITVIPSSNVVDASQMKSSTSYFHSMENVGATHEYQTKE